MKLVQLNTVVAGGGDLGKTRAAPSYTCCYCMLLVRKRTREDDATRWTTSKSAHAASFLSPKKKGPSSREKPRSQSSLNPVAL